MCAEEDIKGRALIPLYSLSMSHAQLTKDHVGNLSPGMGVCNEGRDCCICSSVAVEEIMTVKGPGDNRLTIHILMDAQ